MLARVKVAMAAIGAFIAAMLAAYFRGRSDAGRDADRERLESYVETRKRMDRASVGDVDAEREWLRDRGKR